MRAMGHGIIGRWPIPRWPWLTILAIAFAVGSAGLQAQSAYPAKPIALVVPFPPGGGADTLARTVMPKVAQILGQAIVIENRPGAGGNVGAELVARATP